MTRRFSVSRETTRRARTLRKQITPAELALWTLLKGGAQGVRFRRQHAIGPYIVDFYCPEAKLAVEIDGDSHFADGGPERDRARTAWLEAKGVRVMRFLNADVHDDPHAVVEAMLRAAGEVRATSAGGAPEPPGGAPEPPPTPPFQGGETERTFPFQGGETSGGESPAPLEKGGLGGVSPSDPPQRDPQAPYTPADFAAEFRVSRETLDRLLAHDRLLLDTQAHTNLIARSTLETRWERHFRDSAQLFAFVPPAAQTLVDLGSGAGFPGLVLAAMGAERGLQVRLVESIAKKAAFLRDAAAAMGLSNVAVIPERIESLTISPPDVITARALASLVKLLGYAHGLAGKNTLLILPKGQDVAGELTEATKSWHMDVEQRPSLTSPGSTVLLVQNLRPKGPKPGPARRKGRTSG